MKCFVRLKNGEKCPNEAIGEAYWTICEPKEWVPYCEEHLEICKTFGLKTRRFVE